MNEKKDNSQPTFDVEDAFKAELMPLAKQLMDLCERHGVPALVAMCPKNDEETIGKYLATAEHDGWAPVEMRLAARLWQDGMPDPDRILARALAGRMAIFAPDASDPGTRAH